MRYRIALAGLALSVGVFSGSAHAYGLKDHDAMTRQAVAELRPCLPAGSLDSATLRNLVDGNLDEDINVIVKWWRYSHYFNPEKKLDMRRDDSSVRVQVLLDQLQTMPGHASQEDTAELIGHLIHHYQDMASPPHVVPVSHWLTDGYENFEEGVVPPPTAADLDCKSLQEAAAIDPMDLFVKTSRATLAAAREDLTAIRDDETVSIPWSSYWNEGPGNEFGTYGILGNNFGEPSIHVGGIEYSISRIEYEAIKTRQMRLGIQATKKALMWLYSTGALQ